jgi:hypothetical protein
MPSMIWNTAITHTPFVVPNIHKYCSPKHDNIRAIERPILIGKDGISCMLVKLDDVEMLITVELVEGSLEMLPQRRVVQGLCIGNIIVIDAVAGLANEAMRMGWSDY